MGLLGLGAVESVDPAHPAGEEDDARRAQVSRGGGPASRSPGRPGTRRPPSAGAGAGTRGGGGEGAGSGWERGGGSGGRSSAPRLGVGAPVGQGASLPRLRQRVGAAGAQGSGAREPTCAGEDPAGAGQHDPVRGLGALDSGVLALLQGWAARQLRV